MGSLPPAQANSTPEQPPATSGNGRTASATVRPKLVSQVLLLATGPAKSSPNGIRFRQAPR
jgi:hypothetical protein